jgi:hypothetical protein
MKDKQKHEAFQKAWAKVIAKCWIDEKFKQRLLKNPGAVLEEFGVEIPSGMTFKIMENSPKVMHLAIPCKPAYALSEEEIKALYAAMCNCTPAA